MVNQAVVWFRRCLRVDDHAALFDALEHHRVTALMVACPEMWSKQDKSMRQQVFWAHRVESLAKELHALSVPSVIWRIDRQIEFLPKLMTWLTAQHIKSFYWHHEPGWYEHQLDKELHLELRRAGILAKQLFGSDLCDPNTIKNKSHEPFQVFTPFSKTMLNELQSIKPVATIEKTTHQTQLTGPTDCSALSYWLSQPHNHQRWPVDRVGIKNKVTQFLQNHVSSYQQKRDFPAEESTSDLSAHLAIGAIGLKQLWQLALSFAEGVDAWLRQLLWRAFYRYIMWHFTEVGRGKAFLKKTDHLVWSNNPEWISRWKSGRTGYPLVDAGMRQMVKTGWMHNRLRMLCAMALTKILNCDWRIGEAYFAEQLMDWDFANNNGGWQWSASTGTDAAPYFRIMSVDRQLERFDPLAKYVHRWVPELADLPMKKLLSTELNDEVRQRCHYDQEIRSWHQAAKEAIQRFKHLDDHHE